MHTESFEIMKYFVGKYLDKNKPLKILDVGSYDVNGNYKSLFSNNLWVYTGIDMVPGPNVDIVSNSAYDFGIDHQYDVVVSGNCMEHVEAPWLWIKEVEKAVKPNGLVCIITPFSIGEHRFPVDCWRVLPDGYKYLLEVHSNFNVIECKLNTPPSTVRYRFFTARPYLKWLLYLMPEKIRDLFKHVIPSVIDTFVIAKKR